MTPEHRRYLIVDCGIGAAIVNILLNGAIGYAITVGLEEFPVWGVPGVIVDLFATAFGVAFGTALAMRFQVRTAIARGRLTPLAAPAGVAPLLSRFPRGLLPRAVWIGVALALLVAPVILGVFWALGVGALSRVSFIAVKAAFSAVEAAVVTPLLVLGVLADESVAGRAPAANPART